MSMRLESFHFWIPLAKASVDGEGKRWIEGIASDEGEDLQGEKVIQRGLDVDYFVRRGFFNWDHQEVVAVKSTAGAERLAIGKIGEPTVARLTARGLYVKGFLYKGNPLADAAWELAQSLASSGASRRLGFSIQGRTLRKQGNRIEKAWIQDIAVTPAPVNPRTYLDVAKSLGASGDELALALSTGYAKGEEAAPDDGEGGALRTASLDREPHVACKCARCAGGGSERDDRDEDLDKALDAALSAVRKLGQRVKNRGTHGRFVADDEHWVDQHGIPRTGPDGWVADPTGEHAGGGPGGSYPVSPRSKNRAGVYGHAALNDPGARPQRKALTRAEAVRFIQLEKGYSRATAQLTADLLFHADRLGRRTQPEGAKS